MKYVSNVPERCEIIAAPRVRRDLQRLPEAVAAACIEFVQGAIAENPHGLGMPLVGPFSGCHSARRGSYRIIYRIDDTRRIVEVLHIDHRGDVYRPG